MYYQHLERNIITTESTKIFENDDWKIYWEGFLFIKGLAPGEPSIIRFLEKLKKRSISERCCLLSGEFICFCYDKKYDLLYTFCDNAGLDNMYYSQTFCSSSLLDLIKVNHFTAEDLDPVGIMGFIISNSCYTWNTYFKEIKRMKFDEIFVDDGKKLTFQRKVMDDFFTSKRPIQSFLPEFSLMVDSLKQIKGRICVDLTGGFDTRLVCTIFNKFGLDFDTSISGMPDHPDIILSKKIAGILGKKHFYIYDEVKSNSLEFDLNKTFELYDAAMDIVRFHFIHTHEQELLKHNCNLRLSGIGGEFYKPFSFWYTTDNNPNTLIPYLIERGTELRYALQFKTIPSEIFSDIYKSYISLYKTRLNDTLIEFFKDDQSGKVIFKVLYFFMESSKPKARRFPINLYNPLLDKEIVPFGVNLNFEKRTPLKRLKNIFLPPLNDRYMFEKKILTVLNNKVAKVEIANALHVNASVKSIDQIKNNINILVEKAKKYYSNQKSVAGPAANQDIYNILRTLNKTEELFEILKNNEILKNTVKIDSIPNDYIGSLFTIGKIIEYCETNI
jgi:hypothetical protein